MNNTPAMREPQATTETIPGGDNSVSRYPIRRNLSLVLASGLLGIIVTACSQASASPEYTPGIATTLPTKPPAGLPTATLIELTAGPIITRPPGSIEATMTKGERANRQKALASPSPSPKP